ncbi:hypothetical protein SAMN04488018_1055 [Myroides marinus]|uniref:Uncharacterized protein n=1 Tax=Myroides marinus TaxID=703342 RepID=A0A1H6TJB2_9FLAO|nr:hypothetical protein SAMN04488018_1055 [Myroides marinus]
MFRFGGSAEKFSTCSEREAIFRRLSNGFQMSSRRKSSKPLLAFLSSNEIYVNILVQFETC